MFTVPSANLTTSYCDGLGYALSGIAAYINSFILSATMVRRISDISVIGSRFRFSYQFTTMLVKQVEDWIDKHGDISIDEGDKEFISCLDSSLNSYIYIYIYIYSPVFLQLC
jgi:hypothetical protein